MVILTLLCIGIMKSMPKKLEMCLYCLTTQYSMFTHDYQRTFLHLGPALNAPFTTTDECPSSLCNGVGLLVIE